jgi:hypothetical protein
VEYVSQEDRLRLRIRKDKAEFMVWLTRRYTKLLLGVLEKVGGTVQITDGSASAKKAAKNFQRDAALEGADFKTEYQETATEHPLGEEPVLVSRITYSVAENGAVRLTLTSPEGKSVNTNITQDMVFILIQLLEQAAKKAEWGLVVAGIFSAGAAEGSNTPLFH